MPMSETPSHAVTPRPGIEDRLARMIRLPTVSAERAQRGLEPFEAFAALLPELYPLVHEHLELERVTELGLVYRWRGRREAPDGPLVLMAHYDVVPVDESDDWTYPPFEGRVEDGWVFGRGALDDKGPLVVVLDAVENLLAAGFTPARDVYLSFGGDEESHGAAAEAISDLFRERGIVPWLVVDEGGAVTDSPLPLVPGTSAMVGVGEKGIVTLRLSARGEGGHASAPPTMTAVRRIARAVDRLGPRAFPARTPRAISRMLRLFAEKAEGPARLALRALAATPAATAQAFAAMGGEPAALVRTTVAPTMLAGGTAHNVLPSQASAKVNLRIALGETVEGTAERVRRRVDDPLVTVEVVEGSEPSPESPVDDERFALLAECVGVSHPDALTVPYVVMAATDARYFHRFSPAVYRFAPLTMTKALRETIHGVDERVEVAELVRGETFHRALLERLP